MTLNPQRLLRTAEANYLGAELMSAEALRTRCRPLGRGAPGTGMSECKVRGMDDYFDRESKLRLTVLKKLNQVKVGGPLGWEIAEVPALERWMWTVDFLVFARVLGAFSSFCSCSGRFCPDSPCLLPCGSLHFLEESASCR